MIQFWERDLNLEQLGMLVVLFEKKQNELGLTIEEIVTLLRTDVHSLGVTDSFSFPDIQRAKFLLDTACSKGWAFWTSTGGKIRYKISPSGELLLKKVGVFFTQIAASIR